MIFGAVCTAMVVEHAVFELVIQLPKRIKYFIHLQQNNHHGSTRTRGCKGIHTLAVLISWPEGCGIAGVVARWH